MPGTARFKPGSLGAELLLEGTCGAIRPPPPPPLSPPPLLLPVTTVAAEKAEAAAATAEFPPMVMAVAAELCFFMAVVAVVRRGRGAAGDLRGRRGLGLRGHRVGVLWRGGRLHRRLRWLRCRWTAAVAASPPVASPIWEQISPSRTRLSLFCRSNFTLGNAGSEDIFVV